MKKQIVKESFDFWSTISNFVGDLARQTAGAVDVLGDPIVIASLVKNYNEIEETLQRFENLKNQLLGPEMELNYESLKEEMLDIRNDLEVDVIDTLQGFVELTPTGPLGSLASGIAPLLLKMTIEELIDTIQEYIPQDLDVPLLGTLTNAARAIYFIDNIEKVQKEMKPLHDDPSVFSKEVIERLMVHEGKKKSGTKLCSRGKSAAKAKFDVYPSAYANGYAIQVCKGKIKGLDGKKRCSPPYC
jgi:hypothetical protein